MEQAAAELAARAGDADRHGLISSVGLPMLPVGNCVTLPTGNGRVNRENLV
jgi:hypothetical protein